MKSASGFKIKNTLPVLFSVLFFANFPGFLHSSEKRPLFDDRIIVRFKKSPTQEKINRDAEKLGAAVKTKTGVIRALQQKYRLESAAVHLDNVPFNVYRIKNKKNIRDTVNKLKTYGIVKAAQPDYIRYARVWPAPNDPYYQGNNVLPPANTPLQWGYNKVSADAACNYGLIDSSKDKQVIVAVLDTGVGYEGDTDYETDGGHEDLNNVTITGKNILNPSAPPYDDDITGGHGTNVAGIIAADTNNNSGIAGTAYINSTWTARVYIMPVKVLDEEGAGYDSDIYSGVKWAVDNGAKILNYSFGGHAVGEVMQNAVNYAYGRGCINIAAAGNEGVEAYYPAAYSNVISVASTGEDDTRSDFSNYGKIDVSAPGEQIWAPGNNSYDNYTEFSGTSFSAPVVSGLAALITLKFDGLSNDDTRNIIEQTSDDAGAVGYDEYTGWGRVNVYRALKKEFNEVGPSYIKTYSWPNPFSPDKDIYANITFALDEAREVSIEIYDAAGDVVFERTPDKSGLVKGLNIVKWDGRNKNGEKAASGVYFYVIKDPKIIGKNKIAIRY